MKKRIEIDLTNIEEENQDTYISLVLSKEDGTWKQIPSENTDPSKKIVSYARIMSHYTIEELEKLQAEFRKEYHSVYRTGDSWFESPSQFIAWLKEREN